MPLADERARLVGVGDQIARRHEAFVGGELGQADPLAEAGPEPVGLQEDQLDAPAVPRLVAIDQWVHRQTRWRARDAVDVEQVGDRDRRGDRPHRLRQQRRVDDGRLAGAFPVEQRRAHAARERDAALQVAESRALHGRGLGAERRHRVGHPAAGQVGRRVESALVAVGSAHSGAGAARDDDVRVERADVLDRQPRPFQRAGQPVGQEHVRGGQQAAEVLAAGLGLDVDARCCACRGCRSRG